MKKFKLFALTALLAMGTNAFAQGTDLADGYLRYNHNGTNATITGFVASNKVAAVTIPATVTDPDPAQNGKTYNVTVIGKNAFKGETIITSLTIADANVATIESGAFENCTNLESVTIGKKVSKIDNVATPATYTAVAAGSLTAGTTYYTSATGAGEFVAAGTETSTGSNYWSLGTAAVIGSGAFKGCTKLTTVNFAARGSSDPALAMEAGTFANTAIAKLDLTGSKLAVLNQLFEELNNKVTEIVLPATLTTIGENAFKQLATLNKVDWSGVAVANDVTINANAFNGAPLITTLILPGTKTMTLAANSLQSSNIAELTLTTPATGNGFTVNATGAAAKLTKLTLAANAAGKVKGTIAANAFTDATKLATININGDMESENQIASGSFGNATSQAGSGNTADAAGIKLTVNYTPSGTTAKATASISQTAFAASTAATQDVKLVTSTVYGKWIVANTTTYPKGTNDDYIFRVELSFSAATEALAVAKGGDSKFYYAKLYSTTPYKIAKKQGDATVIVYQGYVDQSDAAIYMENLHIIDGFYHVPANAAVIVKSTAADDVVLTEADSPAKSSIVSAGTLTNEISAETADATGLAVNDAAAAGYTRYALAPIADYGYLWTKISESRIIVGTTNGAYDPETKTTTADFYIECKNAAAARLNVIWLDGTEDNTTAIQTVKQSVEDGVIYNLAGQKVDANYKGVVIKNGKKMIQK